MMTNSFHVSNQAATLDQHLAMFEGAFDFAEKQARRLLGLSQVEVLFIDAPTQAIPEWGVGGTTWGPHVIVVAIDPKFDLQKIQLEATLVHEFHHAMRWRGPGCEGNLAQMLVSEGLATLFEVEVCQVEPPWARIELSERDIQRANDSLTQTEASQGAWFFGTHDIPRSFGYTYGYQRCKNYSESSGLSAADLVNTSSFEILGC